MKRQATLTSWTRKVQGTGSQGNRGEPDGSKSKDAETESDTDRPTVAVKTDGRKGALPQAPTLARDVPGSPGLDTCASTCCTKSEACQTADSDIIRNLTRRQDGQKNKYRQLLVSWFQDYPWLSFCMIRGTAFCHACRSCEERGWLSPNAENAFTEMSFCNWKRAKQIF